MGALSANVQTPCPYCGTMNIPYNEIQNFRGSTFQSKCAKCGNEYENVESWDSTASDGVRKIQCPGCGEFNTVTPEMERDDGFHVKCKNCGKEYVKNSPALSFSRSDSLDSKTMKDVMENVRQIRKDSANINAARDAIKREYSDEPELLNFALGLIKSKNDSKVSIKDGKISVDSEEMYLLYDETGDEVGMMPKEAAQKFIDKDPRYKMKLKTDSIGFSEGKISVSNDSPFSDQKNSLIKQKAELERILSRLDKDDTDYGSVSTDLADVTKQLQEMEKEENKEHYDSKVSIEDGKISVGKDYDDDPFERCPKCNDIDIESKMNGSIVNSKCTHCGYSWKSQLEPSELSYKSRVKDERKGMYDAINDGKILIDATRGKYIAQVQTDVAELLKPLVKYANDNDLEISLTKLYDVIKLFSDAVVKRDEKQGIKYMKGF